MTDPTGSERFSRQIILPGVGAEGQEKWSRTAVLLAGEGVSLAAAALALASSGIGKLILLSKAPFDGFSLARQFPPLQVDALPEDLDQLPDVPMTLVLSEDPAFRRKMSRSLRHQAHPVVFGWRAGSGFALLAASHRGGQCPCLECFEAMNPKAFTPLDPDRGDRTVAEMTGSMAATEVLLWTLKGATPLEGKVWINSLGQGISFHHEVRPTYKCVARMIEEGATVTP